MPKKNPALEASLKKYFAEKHAKDDLFYKPTLTAAEVNANNAAIAAQTTVPDTRSLIGHPSVQSLNTTSSGQRLIFAKTDVEADKIVK